MRDGNGISDSGTSGLLIVGPRVTLRPMTREEFHQARRAFVPDPAVDPDPYAYDVAEVDARYDMLAKEASKITLGVFVADGVGGGEAGASGAPSPVHRNASSGSGAYSVTEAPSPGAAPTRATIVGELAIKRIDREKARCDLGIRLTHGAVKGQGFGGEAFALATRYAFESLGMAAVYADTMGGNTRMRRILDRLGFRCYLCLQECYDMGGRWEDRLDYVLKRDDWEALEGHPRA